MAKIENTTVYPLVTPNASDFVIGTDTSDDNRTVSFSISDITASGGLQDLQSVLDTPTTNSGGTAAGDISLTGNITVNGDIYPTTITAAGTPGSAGQILSSTGTGIQWIAAAGAQGLQDVITVDSNTTLGFVMDNCDIDTTGSINMSGAAQVLALSTNTDMTLAAGCDITTSGNINLSGGSSVLNFGTTAEINDSTGSTGAIGSILTVDAAGTGVEWSTGIPTASMPTLQEVLTVGGNTATGIGISFSGVGSGSTYSVSSPISSFAPNIWQGTNSFTANGTTISTAGIALSGSLWDGASTGTASQVLTSTATGIAWADLSTVGVSSVSTTPPIVAAFPADPITIAPGVGGVIVRQNIYNGASLIGCVPAGGTASTFLRGDGTWVTPTGAVSSVSVLASGTSAGLTDAIKISPTTGAVQVQSNAFDGSDKVGHVPDASAAGATTDFLRADGTWAAPSGGSSGFGGLQTFMLTQAKTGVTANNYMTLALNNTNTTGDRTVFSTDLGASSPAVMAGTMTDGQHVAGCFLYNPVTSTCLTATPAMKCCDIYFQYLPEFSGHNFTLEIWKTSVCTSGTYTAAGSATVSSTAGTLTCDSITFVSSALQTLQLGEAYFITVKQDSTLVANDFLLNLTVRYEMVA